MLITDVQERIMSVFSRVTKELSKEIQEINKEESFQLRTSMYELIELDFKSYSTLATDLIVEVDNNLSSNLREAELIKYITALNSYVYQLRDGYAYIESDEWIDRIIADFRTLTTFEIDYRRELTREDIKLIYKLAEVIRMCCYEYAKAADIVASKIKKLLGAYMIAPTNNPIHLQIPWQQDESIKKIVHTSLPADNTPKKKESLNSQIKLQWNGTNDALYDLFAQLSLQSVTPSTPLLGNTIEGLAQFLSEYVEGMPSVETIERRIRAFRDPNGERPKRNRIEIDITKGNP